MIGMASYIHRRLWAYFIASLLLLAAVGSMFVLAQHNQTITATVFMLLVIIVAINIGRGPALFTAVLAGLAFNYYFLEPRFTLRINSPADVETFVIFVITALLVGHISSRLELSGVKVASQQSELAKVNEKFEAVSEVAAEAESLRKSEQIKTALLDAVTHDLRTPLTSIKAAVSTVRHSELPVEARQELYEVIEQEADRLNRFIQGMMDLALMQSGTTSLESRSVNVDEIVEDALERAETVLKDHSVEVHMAAVLPPLHADPRLISQVLYSLLENAAKYSKSGTRIDITVEPSASIDNMRFSVQDRGSGIPQHLRMRVFDRFFRREVGRDIGKGFGLGLAIAHGIIQAHSGRIWIEDGPDGIGTTIHFNVPTQGTP